MSIKDYFFYHKKKFITVILFIIILVGGFVLYKVYAKELNYSKEIEKKVERKEKIVKKKEDKEEKIENKKVSINTATKEELKTVSYITENIANLIIERRSKAPFKNIEELLEIKGIKENTLAKIKENITL